jgi:micrococcal nuclease|tara:strand:- start:590 stop:1084 length:495 start_codon:yes stop_codon:yes gene_type:complete
MKRKFFIAIIVLVALLGFEVGNLYKALKNWGGGGVIAPEQVIGPFGAGEVIRCAIREYSVSIRRIVDGDTVRMDIRRGHGLVSTNESVRLWGINAPEMKGDSKEAGKLSKAHLEELLDDLGGIVTLQALENRDSFGRILGTIFVGSVNINRMMIDEGYAVEDIR